MGLVGRGSGESDGRASGGSGGGGFGGGHLIEEGNGNLKGGKDLIADAVNGSDGEGVGVLTEGIVEI